MNKNYSFSKQNGQIECNDIMGILVHLSEHDKSSLKYYERLEKIIFEHSKKLRREDIRKLAILLCRILHAWRQRDARVLEHLL